MNKRKLITEILLKNAYLQLENFVYSYFSVKFLARTGTIRLISITMRGSNLRTSFSSTEMVVQRNALAAGLLLRPIISSAMTTWNTASERALLNALVSYTQKLIEEEEED